MKKTDYDVTFNRLRKYSKDQLEKKIKTDSFSSEEEKKIALEIAISRSGQKIVEINEIKQKDVMENEKDALIQKDVVKDNESNLITADRAKEVDECIDKMYKLANHQYIEKVFKIIGEVDNYAELTEDQAKAVCDLHSEVCQLENLKPVGKKVEKETKIPKEKKEKKEKMTEVEWDDEQKKVLIDNTLNKTEKMVKLFNFGLSVSSVAKNMGVRYQFARTVFVKNQKS
jgi:hypothetical protein